MNNVRHSSGEAKWGTGPAIVEIANAVLGVPGMKSPAYSYSIDVDPFSEPEFNANVGARRFLDGTRGRDGFRDRWIDDDGCPRADWFIAQIAGSLSIPQSRYTALVNPPGSEDGSLVKNAWRILDGYYEYGWIDSAVWVAFNLNQFQTLQGVSRRNPLSQEFEGMRCVPDRRLPFVPHSSRPKTKIDRHGDVIDTDDAPSHPSFFLLLPSHDSQIAADQRRLFDSMASKLGEVF